MAVRIKVIGGMFGASFPTTRWTAGYEFVYDPACSDYDWLVVYDELPRGGPGFERLACPRENTILCTWEPVSIKSYSRSYTRQFGHLLTNRPQEAERHPRYHLGRGYFLWFVHDVPATGSASDKPKTLSAVCSSKRMRHTKHDARFRLVGELAASVPGMDWYGKGVRPLARKEDALVPYKYHVAIENHVGVHHWTEKFADAILCECLPFYAGDPAITEIFPADCLVPIPIDDPKEAVRIVKEAISGRAYERRRAAVLEAKRLILEKYNFWAQVVGVIEGAGASAGASASGDAGVIYGRTALRRRNPVAALEDGASHLRRFLRGLFGIIRA